jgi:pectinesterase
MSTATSSLSMVAGWHVNDRTASRKVLDQPNEEMMRRTIVVPFLLVAFCSAALGQAVRITARNPASIERQSETVVLKWKDLRRQVPTLSPSEIGVFERDSALICQNVDLNDDGTMDELVFQSSFAPGETKTFSVRRAPGQRLLPFRVDVRFVLPRADLAWENDRIAFRMYGSPLAGDVRNGIDVWTKRVRYLIVEKWYQESALVKGPKDTYHEDRGEGADFFSVGKSLGAGSSGIWYDGGLCQPGLFSAHRIIATGPIRAMFELTYDSLIVGRKIMKERKIITLDAGQSLNRIEVRYSGFPRRDSIIFVAGLVKRKNVKDYADQQHGWISLWGLTTDDTTNGYLGTAVVMPKGSFRGTLQDRDHALISGYAHENRPVTYYAGAAWTRSGEFGSAGEWNAYLTAWALRLDSPLVVAMSKE